MAIDTQALLAAIDAAKENAYGTDEVSWLSKRRAEAIEAYLGLNTNPAPEGRSQVVDRSVYETISTLMPSLVRIFASSSEEVCKFLPVGPEDEAGAEQTTAVINHVVTQINPWEQICGDWLHDAMLMNNGYCMAYWDQSESFVREVYEGQSDDQVAMLMQDEDVQILQHSQRPDDKANEEAAKVWQQASQQWQQMAQQWQQMPQGPLPPRPPKPPPQFIHDLVIERKENSGKVCIEVLPPEHCHVSADTPDYSLKNCPYFEFRQQKTIAELRSMGLDVPEDISDDETADAQEDWARDRFGEDRISDTKGVMRLVWARMIWIRAAVEDDQSRMYYVIVVGRTILHSEPVNRIPLASMTPQPLPHRHPGLSIAETVIDLQNIRTAVKRGGLDNLYLANAPRHIISSDVSMEDFLDARPGGVVRMTRDGAMPGEGHVVPIVHPFAFDQIIGSLEYFDQERQNRTGASRYFSGTDAGAINKTASGTIALQNMAAMRVEHLARVMAPAVECLFEIVHEQISKHRNKAMTIKLRGQWISVDPQAWRTKRDVRISVGVGAGNKESMMQHLQGVLGAQVQVGMPLGLVQRENVHATNVEILKLAGFANPQKFWPDPKTLPPPQAPTSPEQIKAQTEMQKAQFEAQQDALKFQAEQQAKDREMAQKASFEQFREEMQARQKALEAEMANEREREKLEFERWKASLDAAVKLELGAKSAEASLETARMGNETTVQTAEMQRTPDTRLDELLETIRELREESEAPAELIRGKDGRAAQIKRGNRVRNVVRGPDGRAIGIQ